jgi:hypothetical protein
MAIRLDEKTMEVFINPLTLNGEEIFDEAIAGAEELVAALKFAKKNRKQVFIDHRERKREGKEPWPFLRVRVSDRDWREAPKPAKAGSWK